LAKQQSTQPILADSAMRGHNKITMREPAVLDLFAGAGGFSLGFHWAGFRTAVAIDHSAVAVETLEGNFSDQGIKALVRDLASFKPEDLEAHLTRIDERASFDVIVGGPPCQGWSSVGRGKMRSLRTPGGRRQEDSDPRNELYKNFLQYVRFFKPPVAVMENVPGMLSHNGRNVASYVAESLDAVGYKVSWELLNAGEFGVPQLRERLIFVGIRKDLNLTFDFPNTRTARDRRIYPEVTVRDAIGDLPIIRNGSREWVREYKAKASELPPFAKKMRRGADRDVIFDHVCRTQNDQDLEAFRLMREGGKYVDLPKRLKRYRDDIFKDKYKKLKWDAPSWTVTAHLSRDCYTHIHPSQARTISVREAARLQSFPDCFYFAGAMGAKFQLIGNAVPPILAERVAAAIRQQVFERPKPTSDRRVESTGSREIELALS
jgi:DNA (cytosine-5)-methyltransferase 1